MAEDLLQRLHVALDISGIEVELLEDGQVLRTTPTCCNCGQCTALYVFAPPMNEVLWVVRAFADTAKNLEKPNGPPQATFAKVEEAVAYIQGVGNVWECRH